MRGRMAILIITIFCTVAVTKAQQCKKVMVNDSDGFHALQQFLIPEKLHTQSNSTTDILASYNKIVDKLKKVRSKKKSDRAFLRSVFYKVHKNSLISYEKQATIDETLLNGNFGCLSGTALYALILSEFGFDYDIIELPNHVFINVRLKDKLFVIESTLPNSGLIKINAEIKAALEHGAYDPRNTNTLSPVAAMKADAMNLANGLKKITLRELAGLQYFNESIRYYFQKDYATAMDMINEAYKLYPSKRNEKLMQLVINKILKYDLIKEEIKNKYLTQYVKLVKRQKLSQTK